MVWYCTLHTIVCMVLYVSYVCMVYYSCHVQTVHATDRVSTCVHIIIMYIHTNDSPLLSSSHHNKNRYYITCTITSEPPSDVLQSMFTKSTAIILPPNLSAFVRLLLVVGCVIVHSFQPSTPTTTTSTTTTMSDDADNIYERLFGPPPGKYLETTHGKTHYVLEGPENDDAPLVVLQHGLGSNLRVWDAVAERLVEQGGYRVLRYDLYDRGYSQTGSHAVSHRLRQRRGATAFAVFHPGRAPWNSYVTCWWDCVSPMRTAA